MTTTAPAPSTAARRVEVPADRDLVIDLARISAVVLVVVIHVLFAGVRLTDTGVEVERTVELQSWFNAVTWIFEIMPLFFVVGGFASAVSLRTARARGENDASYLRARLLRLARPALPVFIFFGAGLTLVRALPVDPVLVDAVAVAVGSPLWFLASFLIVQALAPLLHRAHTRAPLLTLALLLVGAAVTDAARAATGTMAFGLPNVVFVWGAIHQLGFVMHDGFFARRSRLELLVLIAVSYLALWGLVSTGAYSWNMLANQYPPTLPLVCLGLAQVSALQLLRPVLEPIVQSRPVQALMLLVGSRAMTIYIWHSPVILALLGLQLLAPATLSDPGSTRWWLERFPFTLLVFVVLWVVSLPLAQLERASVRLPDGVPTPSLTRIVLATIAFVAAPFFIALLGMGVELALLGLAGTSLALALAAARTRRSTSG